MFSAIKSQNKTSAKSSEPLPPSDNDDRFSDACNDSTSSRSGLSRSARSGQKICESPSKSGVMSFFRATFKPSAEEIEDELSDDDDDDVIPSSNNIVVVEDTDYIRDGAKGIVVFNNVYCIHSGKYRTFHLNLSTGLMSQYTDVLIKRFPCSDIQEIRKNPHNQAVLKIKHSLDFSTKKAKYTFESNHEYSRFKLYIEVMNDILPHILDGIQVIEKENVKYINRQCIYELMRFHDIAVTDFEVSKMIEVVTSSAGNDIIKLHDLFQYYMDTEALHIREFLLTWLYHTQTQLSAHDKKNIIPIIKNINVDKMYIVPGEIVRDVIDRARWCIYNGPGNKCKENYTFGGKVHLTNYRICLVSNFPLRTSQLSYKNIPAYFDRLSIPLASISRIQLQDKKRIMINVKDNRIILIELAPCPEDLYIDTIYSVLCKETFLDTKSESIKNHIFAFRFRYQFNINGWEFADIRKEFQRQGLLDNKKWRVIDNSNYAIIETYPKYLIVPQKLDQSILLKSIQHRSKNRFPTITYRHNNGALMSRSAQPISGVLNSCPEDEILLNMYRMKGDPDDRSEKNAKYYIYDARRQIAATLNRAAGKGGTENAAAYKNTELIYCNIENIHVMRTSYEQLGEITCPGTTLDTIHMNDNGNNYYQKLENSGWLRHIRLILVASSFLAEKLHMEAASVLVHCSDGWDRTAQMCSLSQILLDPYFRTIEGLAALIEKEWCSFGFKFNDRCGHGQDYVVKPDERSPVFIQFLDCLYQIMYQYPSAFEYNEYTLVFLGDHQYSCLFGTFLGNYDKMREELNVQELTMSIWSYILEYQDEFSNKGYIQYNGPLWITTSIQHMRIWNRYHLRWDPDSHPRELHTNEWHDNWGSGLETLLPKQKKPIDIFTTYYRAPLEPTFSTNNSPGYRSSNGSYNSSIHNNQIIIQTVPSPPSRSSISNSPSKSPRRPLPAVITFANEIAARRKSTLSVSSNTTSSISPLRSNTTIASTTAPPPPPSPSSSIEHTATSIANKFGLRKVSIRTSDNNDT